MAHAQGKVLFVAGAGVSVASRLPDFRTLVVQVYEHMDQAVHAAIVESLVGDCTRPIVATTNLSHEQRAEVDRFVRGDYDVVLGLLERRIDEPGKSQTQLRRRITEILRRGNPQPAPIHGSLVRLANRGTAHAIVTTNFDLLLEAAGRRRRLRLPSHALGGMPRPRTTDDFSGVLHIHGALNSQGGDSDIIVTDHDLGEFYLRRRVIPDFIYDAARLFHLVFVGYKANEAPMRYLLNAVAADGLRYPDLKERFAFVDTPDDPISLADWRGRGITPIPYAPADNHRMLANTLIEWTELSAFDDSSKRVATVLKRAARRPRLENSDADRDLVDHLVRRATSRERLEHVRTLSEAHAPLDWLDPIVRIGRESSHGLGRPPWATIDSDARLIREFIRHRLKERATIAWALSSSGDAARAAIRRCLFEDAQLDEPWRSAWRLIEESWEGYGEYDDPQRFGSAHALGERVGSGERSGTLVRQLAALVAPKLKLHPVSEDWIRSLGRRRPTHPADLMRMELDSGQLVDPVALGLGSIEESPFLEELADCLESMIVRVMHHMRRIVGVSAQPPWIVGHVHRVYFVRGTSPVPGSDVEADPDDLNTGLAPSVKLLFAAVERLSFVDLPAARLFAQRWAVAATTLHTRLWAALARDSRIMSAGEVAVFLKGCDEEEFWTLSSYPEIAELRARRFSDLSEEDGAAILKRLRLLPSRTHWASRGVDPDVRERARTYWSARELLRIEIAGARLPAFEREWLSERLKFVDGLTIASVDDEFPRAWGPEQPIRDAADDRYSMLVGEIRLQGLEAALGAGRARWDADPAGSAGAWIAAHSRQVLTDLEAAPNAGASYPRLWGVFGNAFRTSETPDVKAGTGASTNTDEATRILKLIERLPSESIQTTIEATSQLLMTWQASLPQSETLDGVWLRLWPSAAAKSIERARQAEMPDAGDADSRADADRSLAEDSFGTPIGRLLYVLLQACPNATAENRPFDADLRLRAMRDAAISASGPALLVVRAIFTESLSWFLRADPEWTEKYLIPPLMEDTEETSVLWRSVARVQNFSREVWDMVGHAMVRRAIDVALPRGTRVRLVRRLVVESLHALRENRLPAVPQKDVQQMLRSAEDEVRSAAASIVPRFVRELSARGDERHQEDLPAGLFHQAAKPFLMGVWPQERTLATPGVARELAKLPAACGPAFPEAVAAVERFLVPFECWSTMDYDLRGPEKLERLDTEEKAAALLRLLDLTIGRQDGAVVPHELENTLDHIRGVAPKLSRTAPFQRLAAIMRK